MLRPRRMRKHQDMICDHPGIGPQRLPGMPGTFSGVPRITLLVLFAILPFFSTALGGLAALRFQHRLHPLMALAAGMLVATALSDLMPEGRDLLGESAGRVPFAAAVVAG